MTIAFLTLQLVSKTLSLTLGILQRLRQSLISSQLTLQPVQ